jgi:hypothetical protein
MKEIKYEIHIDSDKYVMSSVMVDDDADTDSIERRVENSFMKWIDNNMWWEIVE